MLENGIIFGRERRKCFPGYCRDSSVTRPFLLPHKTHLWWLSTHSVNLKAETFSMCLHLWACRLPSTSCSYYLKECDGLKTSAASQGHARLTAWRWLPRVYRHLETAAVTSTCEWVVMKGNEPQPEASWFSFHRPEILCVLVWPKCSPWNLKQLLPGKVPTNRKTSPGMSKCYRVECVWDKFLGGTANSSSIFSSGK